MIGHYNTVVVWLSVHPLWQYKRKRLLLLIFVLLQCGTCHTFQLSVRNVIVCATALLWKVEAESVNTWNLDLEKPWPSNLVWPEHVLLWLWEKVLVTI